MSKIKNKINENKDLLTKFFKFIVIGVIATLIDYIVMIALKEVFLVDVLIASAIGFIVALVFNYTCNMMFVFVDLKEGMTRFKSSIIFLITSLIGLLFNQLIMYVLVEVLDVYYILSKFASIALVGLWNFISKKILLEKR